VDLLDHVDAGTAIDDRIYDEYVRDMQLDGGSQLIPASGRRDRVLRAKYDCEVREELTR
jgi:hypothetical protein